MSELKEYLFEEDSKKIIKAVTQYNLGSYQIGEVARLSALLSDKGVNVVQQLERLCKRFGVDA